jgi:hypothetical protein
MMKMMKKALWPLLVLLLSGGSLTTNSQTRLPPTPAPQRIRFEPGAICARVRGQLAAKQNDVFYVIKAQSGQHLIVNLAPGPRGLEFANVGIVISPSGEEDGTKGGIVFDDKLTEDGDYRIRVARNLMATEGGRAAFVLEVIIY